MLVFSFLDLGSILSQNSNCGFLLKKRAPFSQLLVRDLKRGFRQHAQRGVFFGVKYGFLPYPVVFAALYKTPKKYSSVFDQGLVGVYALVGV